MATIAERPPTTVIGRGLPPGPTAPRAFQTIGWTARPFGSITRAHQQFGDRFTMRFGQATFVSLSDPDDVKEVFTGDPAVFHAGKGNVILLPFMGKNSVLLLDDQEHLTQRKLLLPPLHGEKMRAHGPLMTEIAEREVSSWPVGEPFALAPRMQRLTLEVILRIVFGVDEDSPLLDGLRREMTLVTDAAANTRRMLKLAIVGPEKVFEQNLFADIIDPVDRIVRLVIDEHRKLPDLQERDDILSMLMCATHDDGTPMSDDELRDELMTLLIAGHETTATSVSWAMERLTRHPEQLDRLHDSVAAGDGDYAEAVIRESLRLRPVLPFVVRELQEPATVGGWEYPEGTWLAPSIFLVHRRPDLYPDPLSFNADRWIGVRPSPYHWFPFGGGVRRCVGAAFAEAEMRVVLSAIVAAVRLAPADARPERVRRRVITLVPSRGGEVIATRAAA
ncbi:MAG: cytochrome P450 [Baekduia sp.]